MLASLSKKFKILKNKKINKKRRILSISIKLESSNNLVKHLQETLRTPYYPENSNFKWSKEKQSSQHVQGCFEDGFRNGFHCLFALLSHKDVRQLSEPKINREECRENPVDPGVIEPKFLNTS
jgi:hypothetical protein